MKKRDKAYRPRLKSAMPNTEGVSAGAAATTSLWPLQALQALTDGVATPENLGTLDLRTRWAAAMLAVFDASEDAGEIIEGATTALLSIKARLDKVGKIGATGQELQALRAMVGLADDLQAKCTRRECRDALFKAIGEKV